MRHEYVRPMDGFGGKRLWEPKHLFISRKIRVPLGELHFEVVIMAIMTVTIVVVQGERQMFERVSWSVAIILNSAPFELSKRDRIISKLEVCLSVCRAKSARLVLCCIEAHFATKHTL